MTRHFRVSEADCLEIAGTAHRLIRSDKTGTIWARLPEMAPRTVVVLDNPAPSQCRSGQRRGVLVSLLSPYFPNRDGICAAQGASKADAAIPPSQKRRTADAGGQSRP